MPRTRQTEEQRLKSLETKRQKNRERMRLLRSDPVFRDAMNAKRRSHRKPLSAHQQELKRQSERRRRSNPETKLRIKTSIRICKAKPESKAKAVEWRRANAERRRERDRERYRNDPDFRRLLSESRQRCYDNNPMYRLRVCLRASIKQRMKKAKSLKSLETISLIGCTWSELARHLESQFQPGMTWENYGFDGWHIDHKIPCAAFDLTDPEKQRQCFHWSNLQPLWADQNLLKNDKLPSGVRARDVRNQSPLLERSIA